MMNGKEITLLLFGLSGGLAIFIYGMRLASEGLQKIAGGQLRAILGLLTRNRFMGLIIGGLVTVATQSSSATTVMLVSFADAALMELKQAVGVILGADIGTTLTVQLIAFNVKDYATFIIALGLVLTFIKKPRKLKRFGNALLGFGFIFLGMGIMSTASLPLRSSPYFTNLFLSLGEKPFFGLFLATAFTAIVQSSAATLALAIALSLQGLLTLQGALPIILGANIGTCATALLSSIGSSREGKQVALAHLIIKIGGVIIFFPLLPILAKIVIPTSSHVARQIANAHLIFNVSIAFIFLPFTIIIAGLAKKLFPGRTKHEGRKSSYLDEKLFDMPAMALKQASKEISRLANIVLEMVKNSLIVISDDNEHLLEKVNETEKIVDVLSQENIHYLTRLSQGSLGEEESQLGTRLLYITNDLEHIGDVVDNNLTELARKKMDKGLSFSIEGEMDLKNMYGKVITNLETVINAFNNNDQTLAEKIAVSKEETDRLEKDLCRTHLERLSKQLPEAIETSTIHVDVLSNLKRINSYTTNIAQVILGR